MLALTQDDGTLKVLPSREDVVFPILMLLVAVALLVSVVRDMDSRGQPGWLWGVFVMMAPGLGLVAWLFLRTRWPRISRVSDAG